MVGYYVAHRIFYNLVCRYCLVARPEGRGHFIYELSILGFYSLVFNFNIVSGLIGRSCFIFKLSILSLLRLVFCREIVCSLRFWVEFVSLRGL